MLQNRKGLVSFGSIVAIFGSVLIALGIAWLIAQNWHQIPKIIRVIILLLATSAAYTSGFVLKTKDYEKTGKALLALGALLYTLSIFLIAQIFSTSVTLQGVAWLLLLSWVGVIATAYVFDSSISLVIGLIESFVWLTMQFFAFEQKTFNQPLIGVLVLYFLGAGILLLGISLFHREKKHRFYSVYQWWTAFYFLAFAYFLSFQSILPLLWAQGKVSTPSIVLLSVISAVGIALFAYGAVKLFKTSKTKKSEAIYMALFVILLIAIVIITIPASNSTGSCYPKQCYDLKNKASCEKGFQNTTCTWNSGMGFSQGYCEPPSCNIYKNATSCEKSTMLDCKWENNFCTFKQCFDYTSKASCESAKDTLSPKGVGPEFGGCEWVKTSGTQFVCREKNCYNYNDMAVCQNTTGCMWISSSSSCAFKSCYNYQDEASCTSTLDNLDCEWNSFSCYEKQACSEFNNKHDLCTQNESCQWSPGNPTSRFGLGGKGVPFVLWATWIFNNIIFILLILAVIFYGTIERLPKIINLGIIFFSLDIITRYINFITDFWGYTSLAVFFIIGGIILLGGGFFIEKWRRSLLEKARR